MRFWELLTQRLITDWNMLKEFWWLWLILVTIVLLILAIIRWWGR